MKILFLEIDTHNNWALASVGPAYIAGYLRSFGHEVGMIRVTINMPGPKMIDKIISCKPDLLAVSLTTFQWQRAQIIIGKIHKKIDIPLVAGGLHPTFSPEEVLAQDGIDYVVIGEGEEAMLDLIQFLEKKEQSSICISSVNIPNIWPRNGKRPNLRPPLPSMDKIPFPERDMLDEQPGVVHIVTQRGCPFSCTYCAARQLRDLYRDTGEYNRRRSVENVCMELLTIREAQPINYVIFLDDTFTVNPRWVKHFCRRYKENLQIPFSLHARVDTVNPTMIKNLSRAGCRHIVYGVESGSNRVRNGIMNRPISNDTIIDAFSITRNENILVTANYIIGLPGETTQDIEKTFNLHEKLQPDDFGFFVFYPYRGTKLYDLCDRKGYLTDNHANLPTDNRNSILNLPDLTNEEINTYFQRFALLRKRD